VALVGPSGCGKSTTLRMIAGLEDISSGENPYRPIGWSTILPPRDPRTFAMVFQNYALYQHMSVYDNLAFGLRNKKMPEKRDQGRRSTAPPRCWGLHELLKAPARASSRAASSSGWRWAAALCATPLAFLFDEPLSNLDAKLRAPDAHRDQAPAMPSCRPPRCFVTHDQVEAMTLGDRVVVMRDGRVQQAGTPLVVYKPLRSTGSSPASIGAPGHGISSTW